MTKRRFTLESLLYGAFFLLALLLRMIQLGQLSLNDYEAIPALQALAISSGSGAVMGNQPSYVMLTAGLFHLFAATDFTARFWPALIGAFIVFVPLLFRRQLGERCTLWVSLFLAIDPALVAVSRTAGAESLALVFGLAALGFLVNKKMIPAGIFLGAALASGPSFWLGLLILVFVSLVAYLFLHIQVFEGTQAKELGSLIGSAALTLVILATGFMFLPNGINGVGDGLVSFVQGWNLNSLISVKTALSVFVATYLPVILLAGFGFGVSLKTRRSLTRFLAIWFLISLAVVLLLPSREVTDWVWTVLPLWGLVALGTDFMVHRIVDTERRALVVEIGLTIVLIVFSFLNLLAYFFNSYGDATVDRNRLIGAALPVALLLIMTLFLAWGWSPKSAFRGLGMGLGVLLFAWIFSATMKSAGALGQPSAIAWKPQTITVGQKQTLSQIEDLSLWNHGQRSVIDIVVANYDVPSLRWALRSFENVSYDAQFSQAETPSVIIAPDYQQIGAMALYRGQGVTWEQYPSYSQMRFSGWVKWIFYRQAPVDEIHLVLWARNDLFKQ